jgi:hypothetical protein
MHIAVLSFPAPPLDIQDEISMLKVALLYGDTVTLHSPVAALLMSGTERASSFSTVERLSLAIRIGSLVDLKTQENYVSQLKIYEELCSEQEKLRRAIEQINLKTFDNEKQKEVIKAVEVFHKAIDGYEQLRKQIEDKGLASWSKIDDKIEELSQFLKIDKVRKAVEAGYLKVNDMSTNKLNAYELLFRLGVGRTDIEHLIEEPAQNLTNQVIKQMVQPSHDYPFVDSRLGDIFQLVANQHSGINHIQNQKATNVAFVSQAFESLPKFEKASLDEILDVRKELSKPLLNFRGAMSEYSALIQSSSWDDDFNFEAEKILAEKILPALQEIKEQVEENSYLRHLMNEVKTTTLPAIILALASNSANILDFQLTALGGLGLLTLDAIQATKKKMSENRKIQRERLFFYYRLSERFGN